MRFKKIKKMLADAFEVKIEMLPSLATLGNAFCGLGFIVVALVSYARGEAMPVGTAWFLAGALLLDSIDGMLARKLDASSLHGANLDSLADAISFGVAPSVAIFIFLRCTLPESGMLSSALAWMAAFLYLGCTLWRLARYNTLALSSGRKGDCFVGFPSPVAACMIYSAGLILGRLTSNPPLIHAIALVYVVVVGLMMVSYVPYPHLRRCMAATPPLLGACFGLILLLSVIKFRMAGLIAWLCFLLLSAPVAEHLARKKILKPALALIVTTFGKRFRH